MTVDLVIFDCDGVLVDNELLVVAAVAAELARLNLSPHPDLLRDVCSGRALRSVAAAVSRGLGMALPEDFAPRCRARLIDSYGGGDLAVTPGLLAMLTGLRPRFCVASPTGPERLHATLVAAGLDPVFGRRWFCAPDAARPPPAPDLLLHVARQMGVAPARTLVVDDTSAGLIAALSAGMQPLFYAGGRHLAGADLSAWRDEVTVLADWSEFPRALVTEAGPVPVH
jgi:HAD superfamily hydrolase (TIGR01509 family)